MPMDKLWARLRSRSGASMIFALVVFGIASLLSLSMLSIGMSTVRNTAGMRRSEQAYLSDVAAAHFLQDALSEQYVKKTVWVRPPVGDTHAKGEIEYRHSLTETAPDSAEALVLDELIRLLENAPARTVKLAPPAEQILPVRVTLSTDADDNLSAVLRAVEAQPGEAEGSLNEKVLYAMGLRFRVTATPHNIYAEFPETVIVNGEAVTTMVLDVSQIETTYIWTAEKAE